MCRFNDSTVACYSWLVNMTGLYFLAFGFRFFKATLRDMELEAE